MMQSDRHNQQKGLLPPGPRPWQGHMLLGLFWWSEREQKWWHLMYTPKRLVIILCHLLLDLRAMGDQMWENLRQLVHRMLRNGKQKIKDCTSLVNMVDQIINKDSPNISEEKRNCWYSYQRPCLRNAIKSDHKGLKGVSIKGRCLTNVTRLASKCTWYLSVIQGPHSVHALVETVQNMVFLYGSGAPT